MDVNDVEAQVRRVLGIVTNDASDLSTTVEQLQTIDDLLGNIYNKVQMINNVGHTPTGYTVKDVGE